MTDSEIARSKGIGRICRKAEIDVKIRVQKHNQAGLKSARSKQKLNRSKTRFNKLRSKLFKKEGNIRNLKAEHQRMRNGRRGLKNEKTRMAKEEKVMKEDKRAMAEISKSLIREKRKLDRLKKLIGLTKKKELCSRISGDSSDIIGNAAAKRKRRSSLESFGIEEGATSISENNIEFNSDLRREEGTLYEKPFCSTDNNIDRSPDSTQFPDRAAITTAVQGHISTSETTSFTDLGGGRSKQGDQAFPPASRHGGSHKEDLNQSFQSKIDQVSSWENISESGISLDYNQENGGRFRVSVIKTAGDFIKVKIVPERQIERQILKRNRDEIIKALKDAGMKVGQVIISKEQNI